MKVYHQAGHNLVWNLDSFTQDKAGDGIFLSPVNDGPDNILGLNASVKIKSLFDPQFYLPASGRGQLKEYPFFPSVVLDKFSTSDFETVCHDTAQKCVEWQIAGRFPSLIIPVRYYDDIPSDYYSQISSCYIEPFVDAAKVLGYQGTILLTAIAKRSQIIDEEQRDFFLNWLTGIHGIDGVYLIFEHNSPGKQIKDPIYLANCLKFIQILKENDLSVHIGYNNTEGLLFSLANPDSITMGAYENLRKFNIGRWEIIERKGGQQPSPRLYSGLLFQWIEFTYVKAIQQLYDDWDNLFEKSTYTPTNFRPGKDWNLRQPDLYKHFFLVFSKQVADLPDDLSKRFLYLDHSIRRAQELFSAIDEAGVALDENSDGSHLNAWITAMNLFKRM